MRQPFFRALAGLVVVVLVVCSLRVSAAWAQGSAPPDLIRLKSGGMLRGTIVELVPGKEVTFVGVDGQTRKLPMSDVAYAGPSGNDPLAAAPPPPAPPVMPVASPGPAAPPVPGLAAPTLRLLATQPELTYYVKRGSSNGVGVGYSYQGGPMVVGITADHFERICTAPCATQLDPGNWILGITRGDGGVLPAPALNLRGNEELTATYVSRRATRIGFLVAGLALATAGVIALAQTGQSCTTDPILGQDCTQTEPYGALGLTLFSVGLIGALIPLFIRDSAEIVARP